MHNIDWELLEQFEKFLNAVKDFARRSKYGLEKFYEIYEEIKKLEKEISELFEE
jgi:hypothetical protein